MEIYNKQGKTTLYPYLPASVDTTLYLKKQKTAHTHVTHRCIHVNKESMYDVTHFLMECFFFLDTAVCFSTENVPICCKDQIFYIDLWRKCFCKLIILPTFCNVSGRLIFAVILISSLLTPQGWLVESSEVVVALEQLSWGSLGGQSHLSFQTCKVCN